MNKEETTKKAYLVFLTDKKNFVPTFTLNTTSGKNIREVARVLAYCEGLDPKARRKYAIEAGLAFDSGDEESLSLPNVYDEYTIDAALAQVLFRSCPKIIEYKDETVKIIDEELFDVLDGGAVRSAFFDFRMLRGSILNARPNLLSI